MSSPKNRQDASSQGEKLNEKKPEVTEVTERDEMQTTDTDQGETGLVALDQRIQAQLGHQLSCFYQELIDQPIPQKFMDLLAQLDRTEKKE